MRKQSTTEMPTFLFRKRETEMCTVLKGLHTQENERAQQHKMLTLYQAISVLLLLLLYTEQESNITYSTSNQ